MKLQTLLISSIPLILFSLEANAITLKDTDAQVTDTPEVDACRASGLIALKEEMRGVTDVSLDLDSVRVVRMDKKIENVEIKAIVLGDAYVEKRKIHKPKNLICIVGNKGKVLLTSFSDQ